MSGIFLMSAVSTLQAVEYELAGNDAIRVESPNSPAIQPLCEPLCFAVEQACLDNGKSSAECESKAERCMNNCANEEMVNYEKSQSEEDRNYWYN